MMMITEKGIKLMQKNSGESNCLAVVAGMATCDPLVINEFKQFASKIFNNNGEEGYGLRELSTFLFKKGIIIDIDIMKTPAILIVSTLRKDKLHAVYWTGTEIWDPDKEEPKRLQNYNVLSWLPIIRECDNLKLEANHERSRYAT